MKFFLKLKPPSPCVVVEHASFDDEYSFSLWKSHFPKSPAPRVRSLSIGAVTARALKYIRHFDQLEELSVNDGGWKKIANPISLAQLRGVSPTLKSLHLIRYSASLSEVFDFIRSFPYLETLHLDARVPFGTDFDLQATSLTSPRMTGSLVLEVPMNGEIGSIINRLLAFRGGLHFTKIELRCPVVTDGSTMKLVSRCFHTLKFLHVEYTGGNVSFLVLPMVDRSRLTPSLTDPILSLDSPEGLNLFRAKKLEVVELRWNRPEVKWISETLVTVRRNTIRRVNVCVNPNFILYTPTQEWYELDLVLDKLWSQLSIVIRISCSEILQTRASTLLPVYMRRMLTQVFLTDDHPFHSYHDLYNLDHW